MSEFKIGWFYTDSETTAVKPTNYRPYYYTTDYEVKPWVCPKCDRVNAPWVETCPCSINNVSSPCEKCSNNPRNGGSGICHCILGTPTIY